MGAAIEKTCRACQQVKDEVEFYRRTDNPNLRLSICRPCEVRRVAAQRAKVREEYNRKRRLNRDANKSKVLEKEAKAYHERRTTLEGYLAEAARIKRKECNASRMACEITKTLLLDLYRQQNGRCKLTGRSLVWGPGPREFNTLSIDRIDQGLGYTRGNVRLVTCQANMARGSQDDATFVAFARDVVGYADYGRAYVPQAWVRIPTEKISYPTDRAEGLSILHYLVDDTCPGVSAGMQRYESFFAVIDVIRNGRPVKFKARVVAVPNRLEREMQSLSLTRVRLSKTE